MLFAQDGWWFDWTGQRGLGNVGPVRLCCFYLRKNSHCGHWLVGKHVNSPKSKRVLWTNSCSISGFSTTSSPGPSVYLPIYREIQEMEVFTCQKLWLFDVHPWSLTWDLKINPWKRRFLLETIIFRFHVKLWGCSTMGCYLMPGCWCPCLARDHGRSWGQPVNGRWASERAYRKLDLLWFWKQLLVR